MVETHPGADFDKGFSQLFERYNLPTSTADIIDGPIPVSRPTMHSTTNMW